MTSIGALAKKKSAQDQNMAVIMHDESAAVFSWKGDNIKEYWDCILNDLIYLEDDGKGNIPNLIVDSGGDMNILIYKGINVEYLFLNYGTTPDPSSMDNVEFNMIQTIIRHRLEGEEMDK